MEKAIRTALPYIGAVLVTVALVFMFGTVGAIESNTMTFENTGRIFGSYLFVMFLGAILTNVRKEKEK